jgi:hypothetical protein
VVAVRWPIAKQERQASQPRFIVNHAIDGTLATYPEVSLADEFEC